MKKKSAKSKSAPKSKKKIINVKVSPTEAKNFKSVSKKFAGGNMTRMIKAAVFKYKGPKLDKAFV